VKPRSSPKAKSSAGSGRKSAAAKPARGRSK
jgi:hypothetical protein